MIKIDDNLLVDACRRTIDAALADLTCETCGAHLVGPVEEPVDGPVQPTVWSEVEITPPVARIAELETALRSVLDLVDLRGHMTAPQQIALAEARRVLANKETK